MNNLTTVAAGVNPQRHTARADAAPHSPDPHVRLVAAPIPLAELPAIARAAGMGRATAQQALNTLIRSGAVTLAHSHDTILVVAREGTP